MNRAAIDLGTNTCLLLIQGEKGGTETVLHDESTVVRLGQDVDRTGELNPDAMKRAFDCLTRYASMVRAHGLDPSQVVAVATAQARDAKNAKSFFDRIQNELGFQFRVLSGDEEARATFLGAALPGMNPAQMIVMDIGGGSTEIVSMSGGKSLNIGAVRMTERYLKSDPVTDEEFWACEKAIDEALEAMVSFGKTVSGTPQFVAVAGTAVTLAMLQRGDSEYRREAIDGMVLSRGDAHRWVEELKWRSIEERKKMPGMDVKRADVLLAGALIFWRVMERLEFPTATVSSRGIRYGVLKTN